MEKIYLAYTYLLNGDSLIDKRLAAVTDEIEKIYTYMNRVRGINVVSERDLNMIPDNIEAVAMITEASFSSIYDLESYLDLPEIEPYIMDDYGKIDRFVTHLDKKNSKHIWIPRIIISLIDKRVEQFKVEMTMSLHTMKELLFYINGFDQKKLKVSNDSITIMKNCKLMERLLENNGYELEGDMYNRSPILFCTEREQRQLIDMEMTNRELDKAYRDAIMDD